MLEAPTSGQSFQDFVERYDRQRFPIFDQVGIPKGWVVNARLPKDIKDHIQEGAVAIIPGGLNPFTRRVAQRYIDTTSRKYGEDLIMLVLPDDETEFGLSARFVKPSDLLKSPNDILHEASEALKSRDFYLAEMKRHAYMAVTGHDDTK